MTTSSLASAIDELVSVGGCAGLHPSAVRREAVALSAMIGAANSDAASEWSAATKEPVGSFDANATRGRLWRRTATPLLFQLISQDSQFAGPYARQLAVVASAACSLGAASLRSIDVATITASAQLQAAGTAIPPSDVALLSAGLAQPLPPLEPAGSDLVAPNATAATDPVPVVPATVPVADLATLLAQLDGLVGLDAVKSEIHRQTELLRVGKLRTEKGLKSPPMSRHMVFVGNPGTGKTTVARLVAGIYRALGVLPTGQLVECDRSELVAGYVGQTAIKTAEVVTQALGGVLFIDEAYALASDDFGKEAVDTLVKEMEDHREELVVIVAGYPAPMQTFIASNPGLESRFGLTISFADYSDDELAAIFERITAESDFSSTPQAVIRLGELLRAEPRGEGFGNGRFVRNLFEQSVARHAWRLRDVADPSVEQLRTLEAVDLDRVSQ